MTIKPGVTLSLLKTASVSAVVVALCGSGAAFAQTPAGWKATHDISGTCQIAFPANWKVNAPPDGWAKTPEGTEAGIVVGASSKLEPMSAADMKLYRVDRVLENTAQRVFYVTKPSGDRVTYIIQVQGPKARCDAQIVVTTGHSEDEIKRIAATVTTKP